MSYSPEKYAILKASGIIAKEAHKMANLSMAKVKMLAENSYLSQLELGKKYTAAQKYAIARFFGFSSKDATRLRNFGLSSLHDALVKRAIPPVGDVASLRAYGGITYTRAIDKGIMLRDAGVYNTGVWYYKVSYQTMNKVEFFRERKFVTVTSTKKLTRAQVEQELLTNILPRHDEQYGTMPDPTSIKIESAYYMSANDYKKLDTERKEKYEKEWRRRDQLIKDRRKKR